MSFELPTYTNFRTKLAEPPDRDLGPGGSADPSDVFIVRAYNISPRQKGGPASLTILFLPPLIARIFLLPRGLSINSCRVRKGCLVRSSAMGASNSTLIRDVKIFTGTEVIERGYVHVLGGRVAEVGAGEYCGELGAGMTVVSRPGDSVMPGLIGERGGADGGDDDLRFGVTTVYDVAGNEGGDSSGVQEVPRLLVLFSRLSWNADDVDIQLASELVKIVVTTEDAEPPARQQPDANDIVTASGSEIPYGLRLHLEMRALVREAGRTPADALRSATADAADKLGLYDRGRIATGRKADIVLIRGDVLEELGRADGKGLPVEAVWRDGVFGSAS